MERRKQHRKYYNNIFVFVFLQLSNVVIFYVILMSNDFVQYKYINHIYFLFDLFCKIITTPILYIFYPLEDEKFFVNLDLHKKLLILGLICCIADLSSTYSGFTYRTPADLQIIISNFFFPLTIIINIILKVKYSHQEINSFLIIIIGLLVAILPLYSDFQLNNINIIWILVYFNSVFFGVISYIYQEYKLKINIVTIFLWCSLYELILTILLFWINIIPGIGYNSLNEH